MRLLIVDAHAHVYPDKIAEKATESVGKFYDVAMNRVGNVAGLVESGAAAGIDRFVISSVATTPIQTVTIARFIHKTMQAYPGTMVGLGALHPLSADFGRDVALIKSLGLSGAKIHPDFQQFYIDDKSVYPMYELMASENLPLLVHTGDYRYAWSHPARLARVLRDIPGLTVIAAHFGGWSIWDEGYANLKDVSCFVDTSSSMAMMPEGKASELINAFGAERVLFGVDFPMWNHTDELRLLDSLYLTSTQKDRILYKNACELFPSLGKS